MHWNDDILEALASHVSFEVEMLVEQVRCLITDVGPHGPQGTIGNDPRTQALLEASLIHLRLLDEFLANRGRETDVKANYWISGWQSRQWLAPSAREQIHWRVAHLSALREVYSGWDVTAYALACCEELARFFAILENANQDRFETFGDAPELVNKAIAEFKAALA